MMENRNTLKGSTVLQKLRAKAVDRCHKFFLALAGFATLWTKHVTSVLVEWKFFNKIKKNTIRPARPISNPKYQGDFA
jgi:hypothetical protein